MATNHDLVNGTDAAITGWGGSAVNVPARSIAVNAALTDAQAILGAQAQGCAVLIANSTAAGKGAVGGQLLDSVSPSLDLSTPALREYHKLKRGLAEGEALIVAACS